MSNIPKVRTATVSLSFSQKAAIVLELFKLRLNLMVVISSVLGYYIGLQSFDILAFVSLLIGGFLVTGASNTMNQIIEREYDALMKRTAERPLPTGKIGVQGAWIVSVISGVLGISLLYFLVNPLTGILAGLSMFIYVVLYTPLKRISGFSVFVGAFPGAIPPMLGWVAATGTFGLEAGLLFAIQFMWQFPHFWAIAWMGHEDYSKAGFKMLPTSSGKSEQTAFIILLYSIMLVPVSLSPLVFGLCSVWTALFIGLCGIVFAIPAFKLYMSSDDKHAKTLMFASFLYLPLILFAFFIDKLF